MKSKTDHALAAVKAGLSLLPYGGPIASLLDDYLPTSTQRSIDKTVELLRQKLTSLEGRIDVEAVNKEDFSELFKSCYLVAVRSNRNEKLNAAAALLANLLLKPGDPAKLSYDELDHLVRCLEALSIGAIAVLGAVRKLADSNENRMIKFNLLQDLFPQFEFSLLMSLVSELRALNLVRVQDEGAIRMPDRSGIGIELTPIGRRFFERFIINGAL